MLIGVPIQDQRQIYRNCIKIMVIHLKKLRIIFATLGIVLLLAGAALRIFGFVSQDGNKAEDPSSPTEINDILNTNTLDEINKKAKEDGLKVSNTNGVTVISGYKLFGFESGVIADLNTDKSVRRFECEGHPFTDYTGETKISAEELKAKSLAALKSFSERFHTTYDSFYIIETPDNAVMHKLDKESLKSYQAVIDGKAWLELSIKDKNGGIWLFRELRDPMYGVIFKLYRTTKSEDTKNMNYDIDLSTDNSKGQTK